jgi:glycosyltransferase involved in cell wall biosynthesis
MKPSPSCAVILPALNERPVVDEVVRGFRGQGVRVVVVDNGSSDGTAEAARGAGAEVVEERQRGYGRACLAGIRYLQRAPSEIVGFADCDGSLIDADVSSLLAPLHQGSADLVLGRRVPGDPGALPAHQRLGNSVALALVRMLYGPPTLHDLSPFRALRLSYLEGLNLREGTYGFPLETIVRTLQRGGRIREVPVGFRRRQGGASKVAGTWRGVMGSSYALLTLGLRLHLERAPVRP